MWLTTSFFTCWPARSARWAQDFSLCVPAQIRTSGWPQRVHAVPILVPVLESGSQSQASSELEEPRAKNAVSVLQEFVQTSKSFRQPQNRATLQWSFDTTSPKRLFRAHVAFLLDGVPHTVVGGWHTRKKYAQQDCAEGCLRLFVGEWGSLLRRPLDVPKAQPARLEALTMLDIFLESFAPCEPAVSWNIEGGKEFQA
ncbi:unnamed protein product, partial [Effrenium voratum]